ncbi:hypothetical protein ILUMI_20136 [Ignelater luminosus]|uniref:Uncharacterized protein n=1 Tax=Ignelater luminosus TaxID=2038154 RepID=A0A8K0CIS9_IGNLU|nr:hypothetical protein ILUMI_20136 [Ignelater luminosus]
MWGFCRRNKLIRLDQDHETRALPTGKAGPVAKFLLESVKLRHGKPTSIRSDICFQGELVVELLKIMGAKSSLAQLITLNRLME